MSLQIFCLIAFAIISNISFWISPLVYLERDFVSHFLRIASSSDLRRNNDAKFPSSWFLPRAARPRSPKYRSEVINLIRTCWDSSWLVFSWESSCVSTFCCWDSVRRFETANLCDEEMECVWNFSKALRQFLKPVVVKTSSEHFANSIRFLREARAQKWHKTAPKLGSKCSQVYFSNHDDWNFSFFFAKVCWGISFVFAGWYGKSGMI